MRFIGDIHAGWEQYIPILDDCEESVQVGDYGIGFRPNPTLHFDAKKHRFIRGNHDDPLRCQSEINWIADGHTERGMMFVGGASSIDKELRTPYLDWWPEEQLSVDELEVMLEKYKQTKPRIMVTHECPNTVTHYFGKPIMPDMSRTRNYLEQMFYWHQPEIWVFGHWHKNLDRVINGTRFICLDCFHYIDIEV